MIITAETNYTARIWNTDTGNCITALTGHTGEIFALCVLASGRLVTAGDDNTVRVWHLDTINCLASFTHDYSITAIVVIPGANDTHIIVGGDSQGHLLFLNLVLPREED